MNLQEAFVDYRNKVEEFYSAGEAQIISEDIFEFLLGLDQTQIKSGGKNLLSEEQELILEQALHDLADRKPIQYITSVAWFYRRKFLVSPAVLIPRPETEELVELIVRNNTRSSPKIIDIGTGSGCIAISLKKEIPSASITAIDKSKDALGVAKKNALDHEVNINFLEIDFLQKAEYEALPGYDYIVSNPPYIPEREMKNMESQVLSFEPHLALFVPDEKPLIFYEAIVDFAERHLNGKGSVFLETHYDNAAEVAALFNTNTFDVEIIKDMSGAERFVKATRYL